MPVRVRFNHIPKVQSALNTNVDRAVDDTAEQIGKTAAGLAPKRTGALVRTTKSDGAGAMHAVVESGIYRGKGFYAGFVEFGAAQPGGRAQPYMVPAAHQGEVVLTQQVSDAVKDACDV